MLTNSRDIIRRLEQGWRSAPKGSHRQFKHPTKSGVTVAHPKKTCRQTVLAFMKAQAAKRLIHLAASRLCAQGA
jgi:predicted RNA binding protein YcfA (HicA-like mRNA interferase family)